LSSSDDEISRDDQIYKDFPELSTLKKLKLTHLNLPDIVIFLDVKPSIASKRIENRGQRRQVHETEEKLNKLRNAYSHTCEVVQTKLKIPTKIIDGDNSIENITNSTLKFITNYEG